MRLVIESFSSICLLLCSYALVLYIFIFICFIVILFSFHSSQFYYHHHLFLLGLVLPLDGGKPEGLADAAAHPLPEGEVDVLVPGQGADPGLHVVVDAERHVVRLGDLARRVRDLVLWALVLEG